MESRAAPFQGSRALRPLVLSQYNQKPPRVEKVDNALVPLSLQGSRERVVTKRDMAISRPKGSPAPRMITQGWEVRRSARHKDILRSTYHVQNRVGPGHPCGFLFMKQPGKQGLGQLVKGLGDFSECHNLLSTLPSARQFLLFLMGNSLMTAVPFSH